ncbi:sigma E protease regulator RseP [Gallaecimonas sp. GXIMD4217]|uniref:sigma E protease regulator RseP n=1 Tax=Gallaecimonas sp. GXIMD4217 TaxID=3131927 RepID=UPI00311AFA11
MLSVIWTLFFFLVALGLLVTIHEYGHFWVARKAGVRVERFSIGFGKPLWQRQGKDGTQYVVAAIPLGGYVKMLDERVEPVPAEYRHQAFNSQSLPVRSAIVAAGPAANFLFAIAAYWLVGMLGLQTVKPVVGEIQPQSIAAEAAVPVGAEILAVDGQKVRTWQDINLALVDAIGEDSLTLSVRDDAGYQRRLALDIRTWTLPEDGSALRSLGLVPFTPKAKPIIAQVVKELAGDRAGLKPGDELLALDGEAIQDWQLFVEKIQQSPGQALSLRVRRDDRELALNLVPQAREIDGRIQGYLGVVPQFEPWPEGMVIEVQYGPLEALWQGSVKTWQMTTLTLGTLWKFLTGDIDLAHLSGPIGIAQGAGATASFGLVYFLGFLGLISVNLGIINLLPLPVLDGGHLLFFLMEGVRGKPLSEKAQEMAFRLGAVLLLLLMGIALFNDFARL